MSKEDAGVLASNSAMAVETIKRCRSTVAALSLWVGKAGFPADVWEEYAREIDRHLFYAEASMSEVASQMFDHSDQQHLE